MAPASGSYYVLVKAWDVATGTFTVKITDTAGGGAASSGVGDPCNGGATLTG